MNPLFGSGGVKRPVQDATDVKRSRGDAESPGSSPKAARPGRPSSPGPDHSKFAGGYAFDPDAEVDEDNVAWSVANSLSNASELIKVMTKSTDMQILSVQLVKLWTQMLAEIGLYDGGLPEARKSMAAIDALLPSLPLDYADVDRAVASIRRSKTASIGASMDTGVDFRGVARGKALESLGRADSLKDWIATFAHCHKILIGTTLAGVCVNTVTGFFKHVYNPLLLPARVARSVSYRENLVDEKIYGSEARDQVGQIIGTGQNNMLRAASAGVLLTVQNVFEEAATNGYMRAGEKMLGCLFGAAGCVNAAERTAVLASATLVEQSTTYYHTLVKGTIATSATIPYPFVYAATAVTGMATVGALTYLDFMHVYKPLRNKAWLAVNKKIEWPLGDRRNPNPRGNEDRVEWWKRKLEKCMRYYDPLQDGGPRPTNPPLIAIGQLVDASDTFDRLSIQASRDPENSDTEIAEMGEILQRFDEITVAAWKAFPIMEFNERRVVQADKAIIAVAADQKLLTDYTGMQLLEAWGDARVEVNRLSNEPALSALLKQQGADVTDYGRLCQAVVGAFNGNAGIVRYTQRDKRGQANRADDGVLIPGSNPPTKFPAEGKHFDNMDVAKAVFCMANLVNFLKGIYRGQRTVQRRLTTFVTTVMPLITAKSQAYAAEDTVLNLDWLDASIRAYIDPNSNREKARPEGVPAPAAAPPHAGGAGVAEAAEQDLADMGPLRAVPQNSSLVDELCNLAALRLLQL